VSEQNPAAEIAQLLPKLSTYLVVSWVLLNVGMNLSELPIFAPPFLGCPKGYELGAGGRIHPYIQQRLS